MYKILIKYTSANKKIFWQSYNITDENGNIVEFETNSIEALKNEDNLKEYTKNDIQEILDDAVEQGRVNPSLLKFKYKKK